MTTQPTLLQGIDDTNFWKFTQSFLPRDIFQSRQVAQQYMIKQYGSSTLEGMILRFIRNATPLSENTVEERNFEEENLGCSCHKEYTKANGKCPDCGEPTVYGYSQKGCHYSPITCKTCEYAPCDGSC